MGRAPCCDKANVKRGPWSPDEDMKLKEFIKKHGTGGNWIALPQKAGLKRCGKSCRLRWLNYLRPNIKHGEFSDHEDRIICSLFASIGTKWSIIAAQLPGRTDNDIKNYWNTKLKKKLMSSSTMPIPSSHHQTASSSPQSTYYYTDPIKPNLVVPSNLLNNNITKTTTTETIITSPLNVIQERITDLTHHYTLQMLGNDHTSCSNSPDGSSTNQFIFNGNNHQQMGNYFNSEPVHEDHHQELRFGDDNHRLSSNHNHQWSSHDHEHHNGLWEEINTPNTSSYLHHYTLEEIKQLITSNSSNSDTSDDFLLYY